MARGARVEAGRHADSLARREHRGSDPRHAERDGSAKKGGRPPVLAARLPTPGATRDNREALDFIGLAAPRWGQRAGTRPGWRTGKRAVGTLTPRGPANCLVSDSVSYNTDLSRNRCYPHA